MTADKLKHLLEYDPITGLFKWKITQARSVKAGRVAGRTLVKGYRQIQINKKLYYAHRLAWLYMTGSWPSDHIDHINGNRDDNRFINLRNATPAQNMYNRLRRKDSSSGIKGVSWCKSMSKWSACCRFNGHQYKLGYFLDKESAEKSVRAFREKHHKEFANHG